MRVRPHLRVVQDWRAVIRHAWTIRLILLAGLFSAAEVALPLIDLPIPPRIFAVLSGLFAAAALISRFVAQKQLGDKNGSF